MRANIDTVLAHVVKVFGAARPHHANLFARSRGLPSSRRSSSASSMSRALAQPSGACQADVLRGYALGNSQRCGDLILQECAIEFKL